MLLLLAGPALPSGKGHGKGTQFSLEAKHLGCPPGQHKWGRAKWLDCKDCPENTYAPEWGFGGPLLRCWDCPAGCRSTKGAKECNCGPTSPSAASPPPPAGAPQCTFVGDPHFVTFDDQKYEFMGVGVYRMLKLEDELGDLEVQGFLCPAMDGKTYKGVSYDVALAIKKGNSTLLIDENNTITFPDGTTMKKEQKPISSDRGYEFLVERKLSHVTGYYYWSISTFEMTLRMYSVPALSVLGTGDFAWLTLESGNASLASGLCAKPCDCHDAACQTVDYADVIFDSETIARLSDACHVKDVPEVPCPDDKACLPGSDERKAAEKACALVNTPNCSARGLYDDCVADYCSGWTNAVDAYVDGCREDQAFRTPPPSPPSDEAICYVRGDPHITTLAGERNDFMGVGVYTLAQLDDLEIQSFMCPSMDGNDFLGVSYSVALAIKKGSSTLLVDEKGVVTLPNGTTMEAVPKAAAADDAGPFSVHRERSAATKDWLWNVGISDLCSLTVYNVPAKNTVGQSEFVWLKLMGDAVRSETAGLCAQPCKASNGTCDNPSCKRVGTVNTIFDSTTVARLTAACRVADMPPPACDTSTTVCPPGSEEHRAAEASCAQLDTPKCSKQGLYENCIVDYCGGWKDAAASYVDACYEDEALETPPPPPPPPTTVDNRPMETVQCATIGDPHVRTYGGEWYDFMGVGVYSMAKIPGVEVQTFMCPPWVDGEGWGTIGGGGVQLEGVSWNVAVAVRVDDGHGPPSTVIIDENSTVILPNGDKLPRTGHYQEHGSLADGALIDGHFVIKSVPETSSMLSSGRKVGDPALWRWDIQAWAFKQDDGAVAHIGSVHRPYPPSCAANPAGVFDVCKQTAGVSMSEIALRGKDATKEATGLCRKPCAGSGVGWFAACQNPACKRISKKKDILFDSATLARLNAICHVQEVDEPVCTDEKQDDAPGAKNKTCSKGSAEYSAALQACSGVLADLQTTRKLDCSKLMTLCATDQCIAQRMGNKDDTTTLDNYKKFCIEDKKLTDPEALPPKGDDIVRQGGDDDVDLAQAELDPDSLFGGGDYCCNPCPDDAKSLCCPSRDAEGNHIVYKRTLPVPGISDEFIYATLCPPCASNGTCIDGLRLSNIQKSGDPLHLLITNTSEYSAVWPGPVGESDKLRVGYFYNGRKYDQGMTDGMLQLNLCSERLLKTRTCFVDAKNEPVTMANATLRIFLTDMLGNADPEMVGPKALQFKCPGGTFSLFGSYHPYLSVTAGSPISVEESFTVNGQAKLTYRCPAKAPVTLWSRRKALLPGGASVSLVMEAATVLVQFAETSCVDFAFANMPKSFRQQYFAEVKGTEGGNPLNGSKPLAISQFEGLATGECRAVYSPEHPMSRNWMIAIGDGGTNPGGDPW